MKFANFSEEKKLRKKGYKNVACIDEAGRGPLAGPVVAAAVSLKSDFNSLLKSDFNNIRDSKQLSPKQREYFYKILTKHPAVEFGVGIISEKVIDKINILEATKLAMKKAVGKLAGVGLPKINFGEVRLPRIDFLILDGNMKLDLPILQKAIVKGDEKVFSCAAASIIAKVTRDRMMLKYHKKFPQYRFDLHKGYGTELHLEMLKKFGPCAIHRKSFHYGGT